MAKDFRGGRTPIRELLGADSERQAVTVKGWVRTTRRGKDVAFVALNDGSCFASLQVVCGSKGPQTAELEMSVDGEIKRAKAEGNGPVDATFAAIKAIYPHETNLQLYQVHAVTEGTDAQAEVTVRLEEDGRTVNGQGADVDTLVASARAYINALNKLLIKREKSAPAALSA